MSQVWTISVNGQAYVPYDEAQMRSFAAEGRLAAHSLVARAGEQSYRAASEHEELAPLFHPAPKQPARPSFFTAEGGQATQNFGRAEDENASGFSRYVIVAEMKSQSIAGLEAEVFKFGPAFDCLPVEIQSIFGNIKFGFDRPAHILLRRIDLFPPRSVAVCF